MSDESLSRAISGRTLVAAWLATAVTDGIFASALTLSGTPSTVAGEWQAVAATVLGPGALAGGARTVVVGLCLHFVVALWWTVVFVGMAHRSRRLRALLLSPGGALAAAAVYGPFVWVAMSGLVIPAFTHHLPRITGRWWVLCVGHIFFVGLPMATVVARRLRHSGPVPAAVPVETAA